DINYNIYKLSQQANELNGEIDNLNVDIDSYNDLDEIEEYATDNLGMRYPDQSQFVHIGALMGTQEVNDYIAALAAEQRGIGIQTDYALSQAAMDLLS
ncbi:MAG: cell division protein FtsL, partial [Firmicutes bacterium]|nr:cell division protein FtsL [Bacillota bacterium]